jgi:hypothetical protein
MKECERCGLILTGTTAVRNRHHKICDQLPRSEEVARDIIKRRISISGYAREVEKIASQYSIIKRFELGLERLRATDRELVEVWEEWRASVQVKTTKKERLSKKQQWDRDYAVVPDPDARKCLRCGIVLADDNSGKYCPGCAARVRMRVLLGDETRETLSDFVIL